MSLVIQYWFPNCLLLKVKKVKTLKEKSKEPHRRAFHHILNASACHSSQDISISDNRASDKPRWL